MILENVKVGLTGEGSDSAFGLGLLVLLYLGLAHETTIVPQVSAF
jgi:hypothetical protein